MIEGTGSLSSMTKKGHRESSDGKEREELILEVPKYKRLEGDKP